MGCRVKYFAFPFGKINNITEEAIGMVKNFGYLKAFSGINRNITNDSFLLSRTYINLDWGEEVVDCVLQGFFDNKRNIKSDE